MYDPDEFDAAWELPFRARFEGLPEDRTCPVCEALKDKFIRLGEADA